GGDADGVGRGQEGAPLLLVVQNRLGSERPEVQGDVLGVGGDLLTQGVDGHGETPVDAGPACGPRGSSRRRARRTWKRRRQSPAAASEVGRPGPYSRGPGLTWAGIYAARVSPPTGRLQAHSSSVC